MEESERTRQIKGFLYGQHMSTTFPLETTELLKSYFSIVFVLWLAFFAPACAYKTVEKHKLN